MSDGKRVALYLRVSTDGQTTENQRIKLEQIAKHSGWKIVGTYEDHAISGAKGWEKRPHPPLMQLICLSDRARKSMVR